MFEQAFRNVDDALRKEVGCTTELDYTEQTSWLLFLKCFDGLQQDRTDEASMNGKKYTHIHGAPQEIRDEIAALDAESAEVLAGIRGLL